MTTMKLSAALMMMILILMLLPASSPVFAEATCSSDGDCDRFQQCSDSKVCERKNLLNISVGDIVGSILVFIGGMLAAGGGLGGGGIFIPIFVLIIGMSTKQAVPISQITILGGAIVNMLFNVPREHPTIPGRTLIDYNAILMFSPCLLVGTSIGVILNQIFPSWLITSSLVVTLLYASFRTSKKAIAAWKLEGSDQSEIKAVSVAPQEPIHLGSISKPESQGSDTHEQLQKLIAQNIAIKKPLLLTSSIMAISVFASLLRGGKAGSSSIIGVKSCSAASWAILAAYIIGLYAVNIAVAFWISNRTEKMMALEWKAAEDEILWTRKNALLYPFLSTVAGILGGLLGIGGGMILGPMLLELGMESRVVAATSATAVFLTALSASIQFFILNLLMTDYAIWFFVLGITATVVGQGGINYLVQRTGRISFIVACIAGVVISATIMMTIAGVSAVIEDVKQNNSMGFESPC